MILYPTLEILDGRCVSLRHGRLEEPHLWHVDALETAHSFARSGAEWLHLTDINGLLGDGGDNSELTEEIIHSTGIPVQLGGGFRSREAVARWIDKGAGRIVVGTMAVYFPDLVKELAKFHPDQIMLSLDIYQGHLMTEGWRTPSAFSPEDFLAEFDRAPLAGVIVTDIDAYIAEAPDGSMGVISGLAKHTRHPVIASGVVRSIDDLARLHYIPGIAGALVGRALMAKDIDLAEAVGVARAIPEPTATFQ